MTPRRCSEDGCDQPVVGRGWCRHHYGQWYYRNPDAPKRTPRFGWTDDERFWDSVEKTPTCWLWTRQILKHNGYGHFWRRDKPKVMAHRYAYEQLVGPIPDGLELDHLCRVPACVNPEHLEPVTHAENMRRRGPHHYKRKNTHCPHGHPYDEENTLITSKGARVCRECNRIASREYQRKRRAQQAK